MIVILALLMLTKAVCADEVFTYNSKAKKDPFVPLLSEGGAYVSDAYGINNIKDIKLEGIVWERAKTSIAIINGEIVEEGEVIGAVKVLRIERDAVIFEVDGGEVRIELTIE